MKPGLACNYARVLSVGQQQRDSVVPGLNTRGDAETINTAI